MEGFLLLPFYPAAIISWKCEMEPLVSHDRPSVNFLFRSVAQAAGSNAMGVWLTGMGDDGAEGLLEMKLVEASLSLKTKPVAFSSECPEKAILRGAAEEILPLSKIASAISRTSLPRKSQSCNI